MKEHDDDARKRQPAAHVHALARVEGEGALHVTITDGELTAVQLKIARSARSLFEAFLRAGAQPASSPDITARICGICPVAYQMTRLRGDRGTPAAERSRTTRSPPSPAAVLRRVDREPRPSHVHPPRARLFGCDDAIRAGAASTEPSVERGLRLKRVGNRLMEVVGGRAIHPVNVRVGGFYRRPSDGERPIAALRRPVASGRAEDCPRNRGVGERVRPSRRRGRLPLVALAIGASTRSSRDHRRLESGIG